MQDLNDKITGGTLTAAEWNELPSEIQNVIEGSGQTLSGANLSQLRTGTMSRIPNFATVRAAPSGLSVIYVDAHTTQGDGGEGPFEWRASSTAVDDNGAVIKLTGVTTGRYHRANLQPASVAMYGTVADGTTDDSAAFASVSALTSDYKLIPAGSYNVPTGDFTGVLFFSYGAVTINNNVTIVVKSLDSATQDAAPGDLVQYYNDLAFESGSVTTFEYGVIIQRPGSYRISWEWRDVTGLATALVQIARNGVLVGAEVGGNTTVFTPEIQDIPGWAIGDLLQVRLSNSTTAANAAVQKLNISTVDPVTAPVDNLGSPW